MPLACFDANRKLSTHHPTCRRHVPTLWRYRFEKFDTTSYQEIIWSLGFFAVKRRAVFILGAMWWALVRGWRKDCVVGGMETRFQWRKAHSPYAKCEAFHVAPRLFFMFLFLIPFTIRQQFNHCSSNFPLSHNLRCIPAYTHLIPTGFSSNHHQLSD